MNGAFGLEYQRPLPANVWMVGPMLDDDVPAESAETEAWLADGPPVVYANLGTVSRAPAALLAKMVEAFDGGDMRVLWVVRAAMRDRLPASLPAGVRVVNWLVSPRAVLAHPNVNVFVSHCGINSVYESMIAGTPVVGIPMLSDQRDMAVRVADAGVGLWMDKTRFTAAQLRTAIDRACLDRAFRTRIGADPAGMWRCRRRLPRRRSDRGSGTDRVERVDAEQFVQRPVLSGGRCTIAVAFEHRPKAIVSTVDVVHFDHELTDPSPRPIVDAGEHGLLCAFDIHLEEIDPIDPAASIAAGSVVRRQRKCFRNTRRRMSSATAIGARAASAGKRPSGWRSVSDHNAGCRARPDAVQIGEAATAHADAERLRIRGVPQSSRIHRRVHRQKRIELEDGVAFAIGESDVVAHVRRGRGRRDCARAPRRAAEWARTRTARTPGVVRPR